MRTTIDLAPDLHRIVTSMAMAMRRRTSLSRLAAELIRRGLDGTGTARAEPHISVDPLTGLPVVSGGRVITSENVAALDDEE